MAQKVAIIGAGRGGQALISILAGNPNIEVVGICDISPEAPGIADAQMLGIKVYNDCGEMLDNCREIDLLINVTGDSALQADLDCLANQDRKSTRLNSSHSQI